MLALAYYLAITFLVVKRCITKRVLVVHGFREYGLVFDFCASLAAEITRMASGGFFCRLAVLTWEPLLRIRSIQMGLIVFS
jgi:hypothetical protein